MSNWKDKKSGDFTFAHFGLVFLFLAASLVVSITTYWFIYLEPQINEYSRTQSSLIAQSQSWILADALENHSVHGELLTERMDEILILSDQDTEIAYIHGIAIELEDPRDQIRIISRGNINCRDCFVINIPLYAKTNHELIGQATFYSNNDLFNFLKNNIRNKIIGFLIFIIIFIIIAWLVIWNLIKRARIKDESIVSIFDTIPFPMIVSDMELNNIVYSNYNAVKVFDIKPDNIRSINPRDLFSIPDNFNDLKWTENKNLLTFECEINTNNLNESWALATIAPFVYNNKPSCIVAFVDITATKKAKDDINESKKRFSAIVEGLEDFVYVIRDDIRQIMFANISKEQVKEFESYCNTNCQLEERDVFEHSSQDMVDDTESQQDNISSCDFYIKNVNRWYSFRQKTIIWVDGLPVRLVTITDITKLINVQIDLENEKEKAEVASRAKSEFLATMSHEIRTPMNGILGMLNLLKRTTLTEEQKSYLHTVDVSSDQLLLLLNDVLDITKIESGKLILEHARFKLSELSYDCIHLIENRAIEKNLELYIDVQPDIPDDLLGDETRLRQILINLLGNAVKFTDKGSITLSIGMRDKREGSVDLIFSVIDTGIGIPEEKQKLLFENFSQLDSSTSRKYGGSGLGLAISKKLIHAMNGEIGFKNNPEQGATFYFVLTLSTVSESAEETASVNSGMDKILSGLSILLAEDNKINSYAAKSLLEQDGHSVVVATNGQEAVNAVIDSNNTFDVILMDIHMPEVDGIEACRRIRALEDEDKREIPIIALTANIMQDEKQKCIDVGMNAFITKPFTPERLNAELASIAK